MAEAASDSVKATRKAGFTGTVLARVRNKTSQPQPPPPVPPPPLHRASSSSLSIGAAPTHFQSLHRWRVARDEHALDELAVYSPYMARFCSVAASNRLSRTSTYGHATAAGKAVKKNKGARSVHLYTLIRPMRGAPWRAIDVDATTDRSGVTLRPLEDGAVSPPVPMDVVRRAVSESGELLTLVERIEDDAELDLALDSIMDAPDPLFRCEDTGEVASWRDVLLHGRGEHGETALHLCLQVRSASHRRLAVWLLSRFSLVPVEEGASSARYIDAIFLSHTYHGLRAVHIGTANL